MELDAVEARSLGPLAGRGEELRQGSREIADVRLVHVGDALAGAALEVFELAPMEDPAEHLGVEVEELRAHVGFARIGPRRVGELRSEVLPVPIGHREEAAEEARALRAPADAEKIDDLDEEARAPAAPLSHRLDEALEAREKAIVANAEERAARHLADPRGLDDDHARRAVGEATVPVEHLLRDEAVLGRAPRHHRRHPAPLVDEQPRGEAERREERRPRGLGGRGVLDDRQSVTDARRGLPHGSSQGFAAARSRTPLAMISFWISVVPS